MSVARITEITADSPGSFEDAIQQGVVRATKPLKYVRSAWARDQSLEIETRRCRSIAPR